MFTIMRPIYAEKKMGGFFAKLGILEFFPFDWTYLSGFVVINSGFMASGTFFASNGEGTSQKTCGV